MIKVFANKDRGRNERREGVRGRKENGRGGTASKNRKTKMWGEGGEREREREIFLPFLLRTLLKY